MINLPILPRGASLRVGNLMIAKVKTKQSWKIWFKSVGTKPQQTRQSANNVQFCSDELHMPWKCSWFGLLRCWVLNREPFNYLELTLIPTWIDNHSHLKLWDQITYPFPNFSISAIDDWVWLSYFTLHFTAMWFLIHSGIKVNPCQ